MIQTIPAWRRRVALGLLALVLLATACTSSVVIDDVARSEESGVTPAPTPAPTEVASPASPADEDQPQPPVQAQDASVDTWDCETVTPTLVEIDHARQLQVVEEGITELRQFPVLVTGTTHAISAQFEQTMRLPVDAEFLYSAGSLAGAALPDGRAVVSRRQGTVVIDFDSGSTVEVRRSETSVGLTDVHVAVDGRIIGINRGGLFVWDSATDDDPATASVPHEMWELEPLADGSFATTSREGYLVIWDLDRLDDPLVIEAPGKEWARVAALTDGRFAVVGRATPFDVAIFDPADPASHPKRLESPVELTGAMVQLAQGSLIAGSRSGDLVVWPQLESAAPIVCEAHRGQVLDIIELEDGRFVTSGDDLKQLVWDVGALSTPLALVGNTVRSQRLIELAGGRLAGLGPGGYLSEITTYDLDASGGDSRSTAGLGHVSFAGRSDEGRHVTVSRAGTVAVWDRRSSGVPDRVIETSGASFPTSTLLSGERIAVASQTATTSTISIVSLSGDGILTAIPFDGMEINDMHELSDGRLASAITGPGAVAIWKLDAPAEPPEIITAVAGGDFVSEVVELAGGEIAYRGDSYDNMIATPSADGHSYAQLVGHEMIVWDLEALPDGRLASVAEDGTLRFWESTGGESKVIYRQEGGLVRLNLVGDGLVVGQQLLMLDANDQIISSEPFPPGTPLDTSTAILPWGNGFALVRHADGIERDFALDTPDTEPTETDGASTTVQPH